MLYVSDALSSFMPRKLTNEVGSEIKSFISVVSFAAKLRENNFIPLELFVISPFWFLKLWSNLDVYI